MPGPTIDLATQRQINAAHLTQHAQLGAAAAQAGAQAAAMAAQSQVFAAQGQVAQAQQFAAQSNALRGSRDQLLAQQAALAAMLGELIGGNPGDPCDLSADTPLLLLPVRLETRFALAADGKTQQLKVRIFPDAIHIDTLRRTPSPEEKVAGTAYWTTADDAAWTKLIATVGERRAAWIAECTRPGAAASADDQLGPVARLLPACFVVEVQIGSKAIRVRGNPIPTPPPLGLFGDHDTENDIQIVNNVPLSPKSGASWIADYEAAKTIGLAVTIDLTGLTVKKVDRVIAFGVRNMSAVDSAKELDRQFESHRFGTGLGFVRQGTPTNNVAEQRSGWSPSRPNKPPASPPAATGNRARLAAVLGIEGTALAGIDGADDDADGDARAGNAALWWPTWGAFLDRLDVDTPDGPFRLSDGERESIRRLHRDHVRGRGPLPAIRVGSQPYGVLPIGTTGSPAWTAAPDDAKVLKAVRGARKYWSNSTYNVPRIAAGVAPDATFNAILQMSPVSFGVRARQAGADDLFDLDGSGKLDTTAELEAFLGAVILEDFYQQAQGPDRQTGPLPGIPKGITLTSTLSLAKDDKPVPLPYAHATDPAVLAQIATGHPPQQLRSVLQALAALALSDNMRMQTLHPVGVVDTLGAKLAAGARKTSGGEVAVARQGGSAALYGLADALETPATSAATFASYQPDAANAVGYATLAQGSTNAAAAQELSALGIHTGVLVQAVSAELVESLTRLASPKLSVKDRSILVAEALDTASHRYDAWATALAAKRAAQLRAKAAKGLHIGAFGYVENVMSGNPGNFGFVHAPGLAHAATAGILRSAYLSHQKEGSNGAFAIDLSSARVRTAMDLIAARRAGQGLGEALGYRIERQLQDKKLGRFIRNLRRFAPLKGAAPGSQQPAGQAAETLGAGNVVDGVKLIESFRASGIGPIKDAASAVPADNPYLQSNWVGVQPTTETADLTAAIQDASDAMDAVSDLLMAEAVHQLALGNTARASAALDAASSGASPVQEPAVISTPLRSRSLAHRAMLVAGPASPAAAWAGGLSNPRAVAAPELEGWASERLGGPGQIVLGLGASGAAITLAGAMLCALDFVYAAGDRAALEARLRARLGLPAAFVFQEARAANSPTGQVAFGEAIAAADALRATLIAARPAEGRDFGTPHDGTQRTFLAAQAAARLNPVLATFDQRLLTLKGGGAPGTTVAGTLASLADFGIPVPVTAPDAPTLARIVVELGARRAAFVAALGTTPDEKAVAEAGRQLFGDGFWVLAPIAPPPAGDAWAAAPSPAKPSRLRRWLADMSSVRTPLSRYADGVLLAEALGHTPRLTAIQLAEPGAESITQQFAGDANPDGIAVLALIEQAGSQAAGAPTVALVLDEFNEPLPDTSPRTSAVAFNAPAPGARPPQTLLLAVPPDAKRWTSDSVLAVVVEAFELAKYRGLTLSSVNLVPRVLPATYVQSWSVRGESVLDMSIAAMADLPASMQYVKDA